jgi:protein-S-isoprenylcysteine O-methyltransferase Ste14
MRVLAQTRPLWRLAAHLVGGVMLALLCGKFALNAYHRWTETGSLILLGLVLYNTLLVGMTVTRRPSVSTSPRIRDWVAALLTVAISFQFQPEEWRQTGVQAAGVILQAVGLTIMGVAVMHLGRSFGIVPANRGVKRSGLYGCVRHPLYAGEILFFTGFVSTNFSRINLIVWFGVLCGLLIRARAEENHLREDLEYRAYLDATPYRFFPGLF